MTAATVIQEILSHPPFRCYFADESIQQGRVHTPHVPFKSNKQMTETYQNTHNPNWGERCFVKLDIIMSSIERLSEGLFQAKGTLTAGETAKYLGMSTEVFGRMAQRHGIPHWTPIKGRTLYNRALVDEWVQRNSLELSPEETQESTNPLYY